jgi:hypothetical protein
MANPNTKNITAVYKVMPVEEEFNNTVPNNITATIKKNKPMTKLSWLNFLYIQLV